MPDTSTEVAIATTTLSSAASSITFSSIPGTYTDLRLVLVCKNTSNNSNVRMYFNNDQGSNYSITRLYGTGSAAASNRNLNSTEISLNDGYNITTAQPQLFTVDAFSYAGSTNKTVLVTSNQDENGTGEVGRYVGLYRSTSAITRLDLSITAGTFAVGTTATLYGIL